MIKKAAVNKIKRLFHKDFLLKMAMEKGIGNIQLLCGPMKVDCNGKDSSDGARLDYRTKGLCVVNTIKLFKSLSH
jgi:hypothetical protein